MTTAPACAALATYLDNTVALGDDRAAYRCFLRISEAEVTAGCDGDYLRAYMLDSMAVYAHWTASAIATRLGGSIEEAQRCERLADDHLQEARHRERLMRRTKANERRFAALGLPFPPDRQSY
jgi:hypothetical protein